MIIGCPSFQTRNRIWSVVEEFIYTHTKVGEAQAADIPNAGPGEVVYAWFRLHPGFEATEEEIKYSYKNQIAYYNIPEYVCFVTVFPATIARVTSGPM